MTYHQNRISITFDLEFTTNHQLLDARLKELYEALQSALSGDCADQLLDAVREQVDEDEEPGDWAGFVPNPTPASYSSKAVDERSVSPASSEPLSCGSPHLPRNEIPRMPKTYACFASSGDDHPDIAMWFTPENHKEFLRHARGQAMYCCGNIGGQFGAYSISYVKQPDACTERRGLADGLADAGMDEPDAYEWFADPPAPPEEDNRHVRIAFSKLLCDDKHFWFELREKYSDAEYQTDYFAWADLPEEIL